MSIEFAEKIIDGMVDENGHCGERGLSEKQFDILVPYLYCEGTEELPGWYGSRGGHIAFESRDFAGTIGKYTVILNEFWHFNRRCTVVEINLRPADEIERERKLRELAKFEHSEWVGEPKKRMEMELTLVRRYDYTRSAYIYGTEEVHIYTLADADGNCYVWRTTAWLDSGDGAEYYQAQPGDKVRMRATVKEHSEWNGIKQTVVTRPKVSEIVRAA